MPLLYYMIMQFDHGMKSKHITPIMCFWKKVHHQYTNINLCSEVFYNYTTI